MTNTDYNALFQESFQELIGLVSACDTLAMKDDVAAEAQFWRAVDKAQNTIENISGEL